MELAEQTVDILVRLENRFKMDVLPKFVTIPYLAVLKSGFVIKAQGVVIDVPVVGKIVRKTVVTPVAVAKKDKLRAIVIGYLFGILKGT